MTTNEMTTWQQPTNEIETQQAPRIERLVDWAREADAAYNLGQKLSLTSFVPESFRKRPDEIAAAMLAGSEIGLSPMASLSAFDVIQGRAAARAITLRAVVQSQGHEIQMVESTNTRCRMRGRRKGTTEWQSVDWTIERAKQLGVTGKQNWKNQPQAMLVARATSELCRLIAADAILGIGYSVEEIADGVDSIESVTTQPQATPTKRTVTRRKPTVKKAEPASIEGEAQVTDPITSKQLTALNAAITHHISSNERTAKLAWLSEVLERPITSSKEVTKDEATKILDTFQHMAMDAQTQEQIDPELTGEVSA